MDNVLRYTQRALIGCSVAVTVFFTGCSVSPHHHVRTGADPRYEDKEVAFRTTYYFRVFDYCGHQQQGQHKNQTIPSTNGLYRFKMTGKAKTSTNKIKFESGTLKSWEVDPLGASVIYDNDIGRHRFISEDETQSEARQKRAWAEYQQLRAEYTRLSEQFGKRVQTINILTTEILATLSDPSAMASISADELATKLTAAFARSSSRIDTINNLLETTIQSSIAAKQAELLNSNKALITAKLVSAGNVWLLEHIKNEFKKLISSAVNESNLPANTLQTDSAPSTWDSLIEKVTPELSLADADKEAYIAALTSVYSRLDGISDIANAEITVSDNLTKAEKLVAQAYVNELSTLKIKPLKDDYQALFIELQKMLKKADMKDQFDSITNEKRDLLKTRLIAQTNLIFANEHSLIAKTNGLKTDIDFEAQHPNILALINRQNIAKELLSATKPIIDTAVEYTHYLASGEMSSTLETLKNAMNTKLRIATGTAAFSNASGDTPAAKKAVDTAINCDYVNEQKGFQILGPEGWRTFNPDERLIMAMYTDNAPITQVLKQLSQQVLNAHKSSEPNLLSLVQAELRLSDARQQLIEKKTALVAKTAEQKSLLLCELVNQLNHKLQVSDATALTSSNECKGK
ncbi:hypothetical protein [Rheinheimera pacifica]|uniref:hypothetical protein n=1 Tax=Rheinheimera pacifica TaxID=173990 RepID=UPI002EDAB26F